MAKRPVAKEITVGIVGAGNVAQALALGLHRAGVRVVEIVSRGEKQSLAHARKLAKRVGARVATLDDPQRDAHIYWLCVTDDAIASCAAAMSQAGKWRGKSVLHASGAMGHEELAPLQKAGASVASAHPMMTFVAGAKTSLEGVPFGIEGDRAAVNAAKHLIALLGGEAFELRSKGKALYHAMGSFASPLLIAELVTSEKVGEAAGLKREDARKLVRRLLERTLANYYERGPEAAFSGPLMRGDVKTIERHVRELKRHPALLDAYRALAEIALTELPVKRAQEIRRLLRGSR